MFQILIFTKMTLIKFFRFTTRYFNLLFVNKQAKSVFKEIYHSNFWGSSESVSGRGSTLEETALVIELMNDLIIKFNIKSILDIPCGDFNWMNRVDLSSVSYIGADIVEEIIDKNNFKFSSSNITFMVKDLINDPLPQYDLIIVRDCLVHLSNKDIQKCLNNIKNSGSKYLLATSFPSFSHNKNIVTGEWRPINLQRKPFYLSSPIEIFRERSLDDSDLFNCKSLMLWDISDL
jgi:SAM-dependent methyltransferase